MSQSKNEIRVNENTPLEKTRKAHRFALFGCFTGGRNKDADYEEHEDVLAEKRRILNLGLESIASLGVKPR